MEYWGALLKRAGRAFLTPFKLEICKGINNNAYTQRHTKN